MEQTRTRRLGKKCLIAFLCFFSILSCKQDAKTNDNLEAVLDEEPIETFEFGFKLEDYIVKRDTIRRGDTFGDILQENNISYPKIFQIAEESKDSFDITKLQVGKPYTLLCDNDSLQKPKCFSIGKHWLSGKRDIHPSSRFETLLPTMFSNQLT